MTKLKNDLLLRALLREPTERTPLWIMRQAGRYMEEYRRVRATTGFLELCKNPQLCSEVMVTAVQRLGVDAAIIFSDLLPILEPMGLDLEFAAGGGPVIHNPVREALDVDRIAELEDAATRGEATRAALAHHPTAVRETLVGMRARFPDRRLVVAFQPHRYTRLESLFDEFAACYKDADVVAIAPVFAAVSTMSDAD